MESRPDSGMPIILEPMAAQLQVHSPEEDWTGVSETVSRRKLQNRLNQRAYRKRRKAQPSEECQHADMSLDRGGSPERLPIIHCSQDWRIDTLSSRRTCQLGSADSLTMIQRFDLEAQIEYTLGRPQLCRLPTVLSLNVFHALARNAKTLAVCNEWMVYEAISPFCRQGPCAEGGTGGSGASVTATSPPSSLSCPSTLRPTALQRSVIHHPWIDLFPLPRMRDTILKTIDRDCNVFDEDDLCYDLVDVDKDGLSQKASLIIWGEPWDPQAWEVTEGFLRKWGWLLEGCEEMLEATNYWRRKRGEGPLLIQLPQSPHLV